MRKGNETMQNKKNIFFFVKTKINIDFVNAKKCFLLNAIINITQSGGEKRITLIKYSFCKCFNLVAVIIFIVGIE